MLQNQMYERNGTRAKLQEQSYQRKATNAKLQSKATTRTYECEATNAQVQMQRYKCNYICICTCVVTNAKVQNQGPYAASKVHTSYNSNGTHYMLQTRSCKSMHRSCNRLVKEHVKLGDELKGQRTIALSTTTPISIRQLQTARTIH